ncbi:hypothetical protein KKF29_02280 [Patescibacteria group bacterium]|nr:hypothetical protein [Patescibacteria group bacterium]
MAFCVFFAMGASAENVFDESQAGSTRTSLNLEGGYVHHLEIADDGTYWAGLNSPNGIFNSTDGVNWNMPPVGSDFGNIDGLATSTSSVFIVGGIDAYRTQDGGASWTQLSGVSNVSQYLYYGDGKLFIPQRDGTLMVSSDEGSNFSSITLPSGMTSVHSIATGASNELYILGNTSGDVQKLYFSNDGGASFTDKGISDTYNGNSGIYVKPTDDAYILYVNGTNTQKITKTTWASTAFGSVSGDVAFAGSRVYVGANYTDNNGGTWTSFTGGTDRIKGDKDVTVDPNNTSTVLIDSLQGISKSTDSAATWTEIDSGLFGVTVEDIAVSTDKTTAYIAAYGGLAKTTNFNDATPTWTYPIIANSSDDSATAVWVDPSDNDYVVTGFNGRIEYSSDGGTSWTDSGASLGGMPTSFYYDGTDLYVSTASSGGSVDGSIGVSTDMGQTWSVHGLTGVPCNAIVGNGSGDLYVGVGAENDSTATHLGGYKYDGSSWTQFTGDIDDQIINDIDLVGSNLIAVGGGTSTGKVLKSTDGGTTWTDKTGDGLPSDGWFHAVAYEPALPSNIYVSTARPAGTGSIYKSTDSGNNWSIYYTGLNSETFNAMVFDGLVAGTNTGLYGMTSEVKFKVVRSAKKVKQGKQVKFTVTLKDGATKKVLKSKPVKMYKKNKKKPKFKYKYVKKKKTGKKGKVIMKFTPKKTIYFQFRWKPGKTKFKRAYGTAAQKSSRYRVKVVN